MAKSELKGLRDEKGRVRKNESKIEDKDGFGNRIKGVRDRLKLGPHHKMERFTVLLSATMAFLLLFTVLSFTSYRSDVSTLASAQSLISKDFSFSLSEQSGTIEGVFGDDERTDVVILFRLQDSGAMSAAAESYELFVTKQKGSMDYAPKATFAMFGSTGYGMIRFEHEAGLQNEVLDVTIRANTELTSNRKSEVEDLEDGSFADYDQARFYVNPGADVIRELDGVTPGEDNPALLYSALVAESKDAEIRAEIDELTTSLATMLNKADEYENRLVSTGFKPPETPWFVEGDYIDEDGVFQPATYVARAHKVNYADFTIRDGYIKQVTSGLDGFTAYMAEQSGDENTAAEIKEEKQREHVEPVETIEQNNGEVLELASITTGSSPSSQVAAKDSVQSLVSTWQTYLTTKREIQQGLMSQLLILDADVLSQPSMFSEHTGDSVVTYY